MRVAWIGVLVIALWILSGESLAAVLQVEVSQREWVNMKSNEDYDIWSSSQLDQQRMTAVLLVSDELIKGLEENPEISNIRTILTSSQLSHLLSEDRKARMNAQPWNSTQDLDSFFLEFRTYDEIDEFCQTLISLYPTLISKFQVGKTWEGATIYGYRFTGKGDISSKPAIWLEALQHAREWLAPPTLLYTFYTLLEEYQIDPEITQLVDGLTWYIVPVVNIDGYKFTWESEDNRLWRKNRHILPSGVIGVDLNRNWGPNTTWCTTGATHFPPAETYCGPYPFSEPESSSLAAAIAKVPEVKAGIDFHTYGPLLLWPWQYTYDHVEPAANYTMFSTLGADIVNAINAVNGMDFVSEQGSDLYLHSGGFVDYNYGETGMLAFTLELRGDWFVVPASDILPSGTEAFQGVLVLANYVLDNY